MLSDSHKYFTIVNYICSFLSLIPEVFLFWLLYLVLKIPIKYSVTVTNILYLAIIYVLFIYDHLCIPFIRINICFFSFMPSLCEIVCTCLSIHIAHTYQMLSDGHQYFTLSSHINSFTYIHTHIIDICMCACICHTGVVYDNISVMFVL